MAYDCEFVFCEALNKPKPKICSGEIRKAHRSYTARSFHLVRDHPHLWPQYRISPEASLLKRERKPHLESVPSLLKCRRKAAVRMLEANSCPFDEHIRQLGIQAASRLSSEHRRG